MHKGILDGQRFVVVEESRTCRHLCLVISPLLWNFYPRVRVIEFTFYMTLRISRFVTPLMSPKTVAVFQKLPTQRSPIHQRILSIWPFLSLPRLRTTWNRMGWLSVVLTQPLWYEYISSLDILLLFPNVDFIGDWGSLRNTQRPDNYNTCSIRYFLTEVWCAIWCPVADSPFLLSSCWFYLSKQFRSMQSPGFFGKYSSNLSPSLLLTTSQDRLRKAGGKVWILRWSFIWTMIKVMQRCLSPTSRTRCLGFQQEDCWEMWASLAFKDSSLTMRYD